MKTYKVIEKSSTIQGIPSTDFGLYLVAMFSLVFLGSLLGVFINISGWYFLAVLIIGTLGFFILKMAYKRKHPSLLLSFISYYFMQPKKIKATPVKLKHLSEDEKNKQ